MEANSVSTDGQWNDSNVAIEAQNPVESKEPLANVNIYYSFFQKMHHVDILRYLSICIRMATEFLKQIQIQKSKERMI